MTSSSSKADAPPRFAAAHDAWRTLLVHVQPEPEAQPRLAAAADLARRFDAVLVGLGAEMMQPIAASDPYGMLGGEVVAAVQDMLQKNIDRAGVAFETATKGLTREWLTVQDLPGRAINRLARRADLIVAGGAPTSDVDAYRACDTGELIVQSGRPVLVAPPAGGQLAAEAVVIAWKDSREARRAVADAMPLLKGARDVLLVEVVGKADAADAAHHHAAVVAYLATHGVKARSRAIAGAGTEAYGCLQGEARAIGADLIVAGGYGHSRMGEWVFGGLTADLLAEPQRFVLFSH